MNKTIKVIDLLNKKFNGEIPKRIKYNNDIYKYSNYYNDYLHETKNNLYILFVENIIQDLNVLDDTIEIIEDKEDINIQGICGLPEWGYDDDDIRRTINELVQAVKYLEKTKEDK